MMDFYAMLDQVVDLLRRRGRVSYRALKRQFALDDELLADLKAEFRYAHYPIERERYWEAELYSAQGRVAARTLGQGAR